MSFSTRSMRFLFALLLPCQLMLAQAPNGYTLCAGENQSFTLPAKSHLAYGADNHYKYLFNQTGTVTFSNDAFGGDPIFGVGKSGYYKIADGSETPAVLSAAMLKIKKHITGTTVLTAAQIISVANTIQQNIFVIADTSTVVLDAFALVDCYETLAGPIFLNSATMGGFPNDFGATDGYELVRAVFLVQQGIMDYIYTPTNIQKYKSILAGRYFKTATHFPGVCPAPIDPLTTYTAKINATMPAEYGKRTAFSSTPARRPTGYYLAPGNLGKVKVPAALVGKGFKILVGAHSFERTGSNPCRRFFRVTNTFPITDTITEIQNPFGGGIYIITPYQATEGVVDIQLTNVVPAPFFSAKSFDKTTLQNWLEVQRMNPAPWADFESDKFMMQVPRSWIYNYADPVTLMADWDKRMDVVSKLLGYPPIRSNTMLYLQIDVDIMFGGYGIGNPQINNTYDPSEVENGNKNHWFLKPGVDFWETEFHEMGHAQLFSGFPGEGEAIVNLLAAAIYNRLYGMNIDTALGNSFGKLPQITRDQAAMNWMVTPNFRAGNPMDISNTTKDEVRYQQRGYAKYVEMAALFGWEMLDSFYKKENLDFIAQTPGDGLSDVDSRILRFSRTAGADLRPLVHFWGVQPKNASVLKARIDAENLKPSKLICDRLTHYKTILPANNAEFLVHANAFFGGSIPAGGDPDYGSGWYNIWKAQYNSTHGTLGKQAMQNIIDLYFPGGCPTATPPPTVTVANQSICPGQSATLTASGAAYYQWSNGETGNSITVTPTESTTFTVIGKTSGVSAAPVSAQVTVNPIPVVSVNAMTICAGQSATLTANGATNYEWSNGESGSSIHVGPATTTTYSAIGTSLGCTSAPVSTQITVNPLPIVSVNEVTICAGQSAALTADGASNYEWNNGETGNSINVNPTTTSIYSVIGTSLGCTSVPVSTQVTVNPLPVVSVNEVTICNGQSATLAADGATNYEWNTGETGSSINVNPIATSTYFVIGTSLGCTSAPVSAQVTVNPLPVVSVNEVTICDGQSATLTADGATKYEWSTGETGSSINVSPTQTAAYSVIGTSLGCASAPVTAQVTVNPLPVVSVNEVTICAGQSATLTADGATNYEWNTGETGSSINVSPAVTSTYSVIGTSLGCTSAPVSAQVTANPLPVISVNEVTICAGQSATLTAAGAANYEWNNGEMGNSINVSPTQTTAYSVIGTSLGCVSALVSAQVTVNPLPIVSVNEVTICAGQSAALTADGATSYEWNNGEMGSSIIVSPTQTTAYSVIGTSLGCASAPVSTQVTVNPLPAVSVNEVTICAGQSAALTADGATSYEWSTGETSNSIDVSPAQTTTYSVIGTTLGCSASAETAVIVNPLPTVDLGADIQLPAGQNATLNAGGTDQTYQWSTGSTTATIAVNSMGVFTVTVTNSAGCTATDEILVTIIVSTIDQNGQFSLSLMPNPTQDLVNIICTGSATTSAQVLDNLGRLVYSDHVFVQDGDTRSLNIGHLPPGTYFVKIIGEGFVKTIPVIKQ
jgi:hypothetical protein